LRVAPYVTPSLIPFPHFPILDLSGRAYFLAGRVDDVLLPLFKKVKEQVNLNSSLSFRSAENLPRAGTETVRFSSEQTRK
jgi:hypothetical protein